MSGNSGICYIFGAGELKLKDLVLSPGDMCIAADGGYNHLARLNLKADILVGDLDSLKTAPGDTELVLHPKEKDDTDMILAAKEGLNRGYRRFVLYGGTGGELDHTLANIQLLGLLSGKGAQAYLSDGHTVITAVSDGRINFDKTFDGKVSVFAFGGKAEGVMLTGLKYPLLDVVLAPTVPLGARNEFLGEPATVEVKNGTLIIVFTGKIPL